MTVTEWADKYRKLSKEASEEVGSYRSSFAPYQREMQNVIHEDGVHTAVFMMGSQVGKTETINNIVGYCLDVDPYPMLVVQPKDDKADEWSKERLKPMLRDSLTSEPGKRKLGEKIDPLTESLRHKTFSGGFIAIAGANSPANLAGKPLPRVFLDEIDRYPASAGTEGDPCDLAMRRTTNWANKFHLLTSTPTIKRASRIEAAFLKSDQRRWYVPCPCCEREQSLKWRQVKFENRDSKTARYLCEFCPSKWTDEQLKEVVLLGRWIAEKPENLQRNGIAGFHLSALYSPWQTLADVVQSFLDSKDWPERKKVWVNTVLGETHEESGEAIDDSELAKRIEDYGDYSSETPDRTPILPREVVLLTAGCDVHPDRIECEVVGWGIGEECWGVEYKVFHGKTTEGRVWERLHEHLLKEFPHVSTDSGVKLKIKRTFIDSGGHQARQAYAFARPREKYGIYVSKGYNLSGQPIVGRMSRTNSMKAKLFMIGTDTAKEWLFGRLSVEEPGPGYCHFPRGFGYDAEYFAQLTAEKVTIVYKNGWPSRKWVPLRARNEALDCRVLAIAAFEHLKPNLARKANKLEQRAHSVKGSTTSAREASETKAEPESAEGSETETAAEVPAPKLPETRRRMVPRRSNFATSWKK